MGRDEIAALGLIVSATLCLPPAQAQVVRADRAPTSVSKPALTQPVRKQAPRIQKKLAPAGQTTQPFQAPAQSTPLPPPRPTMSPESQEARVQSSDRAAQAQLNMVRTAPEQVGQVPQHFFWIRQGLQAAQDPVDGALVFITDEGRIAGRAKLPGAFTIDEIIADASQVRLIDGGRRQVSIPRTIDPGVVGTLSETSFATNGTPRSALLTRRGPQHLILNDARRSGARALDIRALAGGHLAQAYEISPGTGEVRYVVTEEIVASKPALDVRVFVQRFDREGLLIGVAHVSLESMDSVPRDFLIITGDGTLRALIPASDGIKFKDFVFTPPPQGKQRTNSDPNTMGRMLREVPVDTKIDQPEGAGRFPRSGEIRFRIEPPMPPISRENVIRNASAYLSVNWTMAPENFSRAGIENACVPNEAKFWRRPTRFTSATVGETIGPMPYRWGGDDTPQTFRLRLEWGALAGSICTCRDPALDYCLSPESIGVDCSGLISRAWGIEKRGTSGLLDVSTELNGFTELKPGDAFDWPGRHVRLFVGTESGAALAYTVIESATRLECEGVCMRTYRPSELYGYKLIRYRSITD